MNCLTTWEELLSKIVLSHEVGELIIRYYNGTIMAIFYPEDTSRKVQYTTLVVQKYDVGSFGWHDIRTLV